MSDALAVRWAELRTAHRPGLIPYITAGYPSRTATLDALHMLEDEGADIIELGIPFSDPVADGPVIQQSTHAALAAGMSVRGALELVTDARLGVPLIAFSYTNPILSYGIEAFLRDAAAAGVSALLLTDLPAGADETVEHAVRESPLAHVPLVALTTTAHRLDEVLHGAQGFVYVISRLGVTGGSVDLDAGIEEKVAAVRARTPLPVAVGFGIDSGEKGQRVAAFADGVIVGSALVARLGMGPGGLDSARVLMRELRSALDAVPVA